uniref:Senescence regulator S40 n=1 Tax=Opuntia streptacantha TaxID=393608 RepID=A0A7C9CGD8_OPUST
MEKRNGFRRHSTSTSIRRYRSEEYQEEDVWGVIRSEERQTGFSSIDIESSGTSSPLSISRRLPSAARMIPSGAQKHEHPHHDDGMMQHSSAPVNIPDWSKIYGKTQRRMNDGHLDGDDDVHDVDDDDDEGRLTLPPHEWLARKMARSQISTFSVCEGAGRTLKGRDLSRVRHAVLSKTGFI